MKQNIPTACYGWCKNDGKCGVQSKKCPCPDPGAQENQQCNEGNEFRIIITLSQVRARKNMQETKNNINIIDKMDENIFIIGVILQRSRTWVSSKIDLNLCTVKRLFSYFYTNIFKCKKIEPKFLSFILQLIICYRFLKFFNNLGRKLYIPKQTVRMAWQ